ncbi:MAG TPA: AMP-binding protein [Steroidobacteraceae bacterium]|nr:AMP-binding protein [Steroidobacteraceae bacterium]
MEVVPLLAHASATSVVAYRRGRPISAGEFMADAVRVAAILPGGAHMLNACGDRYRFAVGLAAALITNKVSLLPPTCVPEVIRQLRAFAPDAFCLTDDAASEIQLPIVRYPPGPAAPLDAWRVPGIPGDRLAAYVFTSGSTGAPVPHAKTWGRLAQSMRVGAQRLGLDATRPCTLVATVPPQHMFGFESSVLVALHAAQSICAEHPFYPADIASVLAAVPRPRALVSTPIHLRTLLAAGIPLPAVDLLVCATAPLDARLAEDAEQRFDAPLLEIYGSTETGQIASRRTVDGAEWSLWPSVELVARGDRIWAQGRHIEAATALGDIVEITAPGRFLLRGRTADLVNIAGKRSSIAYLNHQLNAIPGVLDGAFFLGDEPAHQSATGIARLGALVVAPGLTVETILRQLRDRLDPVFLPRPLLLVDSIPRNSTGKLPRAALRSFAARG